MAELKVYRTEKPNTGIGTWNESFDTFTVASQSLSPAGTYEVQADEKDEHTVFFALGGSSNGSVVIKAGNGYAGVSDFTIPVTASKYQAFTIDSARFADKHTGKVTLVATNCSILAVAPRV